MLDGVDSFGGHAVPATQVASVGDGKTQVLDLAAEIVFQSFASREK
jgi:hypothetical protein